MPEEKEKLISDLDMSLEMIRKNIQAQNTSNKLREDAKRSTIALFSIIGVFVLVSYINTKRVYLLNEIGIQFQFSTAMILLAISIVGSLIVQKYVVKKRLQKVEDSDQMKNIEMEIQESHHYLNSESILPKQYWQIGIAEKLNEYVINKRADTLKEALNLYESERLHLDKMDSLNELKRVNQQVASQVAWSNFINATRK